MNCLLVLNVFCLKSAVLPANTKMPVMSAKTVQLDARFVLRQTNVLNASVQVLCFTTRSAFVPKGIHMNRHLNNVL